MQKLFCVYRYLMNFLCAMSEGLMKLHLKYTEVFYFHIYLRTNAIFDNIHM